MLRATEGHWTAVFDRRKPRFEARQQIWKLGNFGCGFMVKAYERPESISTTVARALRQYEAFKRDVNYPLVEP